MTFKVDQQVQWQSSSGGSTTTREGKVIRVVDPGQKKVGTLMYRLAQRLGAKNEYGGGMSRNHQSYIVLVRSEKGRAKPRLYWPVASKLQAVEG
jgi:hypothetical protein